MNPKQFESTSTDNKIAIDNQLRGLIKISPLAYVIMLIGAPDGLERHYQNVLAWGGAIDRLVIVDICASTIDSLIEYHLKHLNHYPMPLFIVGDLNEVLENLNAHIGVSSLEGGVIDFDGTTVITAEYHLKTVLLAEQLKAKYLIMVASARGNDPGMSAIGSELDLVERRVYIDKEEQLKTRGKFHESYSKKKKTVQSNHDTYNDVVSGRGHSIIMSQAYYGVSPMVLTAIQLSNECPHKRFEQIKIQAAKLISGYLNKAGMENMTLKAACTLMNQTHAENSVIFEMEELARLGCGVEHHLKHIATDYYKDLIKCERLDNGCYRPSHAWLFKHDNARFKIFHPEDYRKYAVKNGFYIAPRDQGFTKRETDELIKQYTNICNKGANALELKEWVDDYCKREHRSYAVVQLKLKKLGLWKKLNGYSKLYWEREDASACLH